MTNIITKNDKCLKTFEQFCNFLNAQKKANLLSHKDYIPIIVWGDIAGKRVYFINGKIKYFYIFTKFTLNTLLRKFHEYGITECHIDTSSMPSITYKSKNNNLTKKYYLSSYK